MSKTVAVIGGGVSGLVSAKACLEVGLIPTIFESTGVIGGIWSPYSKHVPQTLTTNVSKYICTLSDFPWDTDSTQLQTPTFPSAAQVGKYLQRYAQNFLTPSKCIRLHTKVTRIELFNATRGQWLIKHETALGGPLHNPLPPRQGHGFYDYLIIASGFFSKPFIPPSAFTKIKNCPVFHYSQAEILLEKGKLDLKSSTVVVIGGSLSGVELAGTLYQYKPKHVLHITKKPLVILPLLLPEDPSTVCPTFVPIDLALMAKISSKSKDSYPECVKLTGEECNRLRTAQLTKYVGDQTKISPVLQVNEDDTPFIGVSDTYAELVRNGQIELIRGEFLSADGEESAIKIRQNENGGDSEEYELKGLDNLVIIFATGFSTEMPFLPEPMLQSMDFDPTDLFQPLLLGAGVLNPKLPHTAFVGMYRGPYFSVIEMQAKYVASLFAGTLPWPSTDSIQKDISEEKAIRSQFPRYQFPHPTYTEHLNMHVNLAQSYERPEENYALPSKYSSSFAATKILQDFHSDLKEMQAGRFTAVVVFRNLFGIWEMEQQGVSNLIIAEFTRNINENGGKDQNESYVYSENNIDLESYEYNVQTETLIVTKNNVQGNVTFVPNFDAGWKGNANLVDSTGIQWIFEFLFPFDGIYVNTFTKRVGRLLPHGSLEETNVTYRRPRATV